jgi:hypothetical protein
MVVLFKIWFDVVLIMFNEVINTCFSPLIEDWFKFEETMDLTQWMFHRLCKIVIGLKLKEIKTQVI